MVKVGEEALTKAGMSWKVGLLLSSQVMNAKKKFFKEIKSATPALLNDKEENSLLLMWRTF